MKKRTRPRSDGRLETIDTVLHQLFSDGKFGSSVQVARLETSWDKIVGQDAAVHCSPEKIQNGKLYIRVDAPVWRQQLDLSKEVVLEKIARHLEQASVTRIICRSTPSPPPPQSRLR